MLTNKEITHTLLNSVFIDTTETELVINLDYLTTSATLLLENEESFYKKMMNQKIDSRQLAQETFREITNNILKYEEYELVCTYPQIKSWFKMWGEDETDMLQPTIDYIEKIRKEL